ncbi:Predicted arabinose efflux permease, MFS family [Prauserella marina]|uniref:Predicted arabinose efflux permease, MFS family n=1 Tax=Prauserella marina TaxID=530584 RepID=A0A1G6PVV5_9PSEU|nr:MFS transporter [Prauserella marina]PWV78334.1 putative MFS family arabinose efflux permease [Prauserella marina]SDC83666.1 Predicted arabinose efflux permease, MFS family [Prauserella marina]
MPFQPYRQVLRIPGVPASMLLMFFARLPMTAMGLTLTLHIVSDLGRGYGAAGLVGAATTAGTALGAPLIGRLIDRHGLRPVVLVCGAVSCAYWISTPHLPFYVLLAVALPAGALVVPAGSIARQVLTALVPTGQRRTAYALDTISVEATFMVGPGLGILVSTQLSSSVALTGIGVAFGLLSVALFAMNPPIRTAEENSKPATARPPIRSWLSRPLIATLLTAAGALFVLIGTELAALAVLRASGEVDWTGVVIAVMCIASLIGGLAHGVARHSLSQLRLMLLLSVLVIPVALVAGPWWLLALALIPTNVVCAPTLAATTESVSKLAPPAVRGEAMGLQDSATRIGLALGSPVVGFVIDHSQPGWGFVAAGLGGLTFAAMGIVLRKRPTKAATTRPKGKRRVAA